ncbi:MAG TPA: maleylacetate reductase [Actinomycetota bacterium]|nr:maleylacetate reductase [Actinomycetota bacterium]
MFGWNRLDDIAGEVERLSGGRVLLITERSTRPVAQRLEQELGSRVAASIRLVRPHVPAEDATDARELARREAVDLIVSIGGGSATGLGKAVGVAGIPLLAIPTTYAGSEMTPIYGITEDGRKQTCRDERVLPRTVLYDPALTTSLPRRPTATTGMNAIAHGVEALYAQNRSPRTDLLAAEATRLLSRALPECVEKPSSKSARSTALYGAYLAGTVLAGTGMALHHRICHVLGGAFGVAHGDANAVVLPHVVAFNAPAAPEAIEIVGDALGAQDPAGALFDLSASMEAPTALEQLGVQQSDLEHAAAQILEQDFYNPRHVDRDGLTELLRNAYAGRRPD